MPPWIEKEKKMKAVVPGRARLIGRHLMDRVLANGLEGWDYTRSFGRNLTLPFIRRHSKDLRGFGNVAGA